MLRVTDFETLAKLNIVQTLSDKGYANAFMQTD